MRRRTFLGASAAVSVSSVLLPRFAFARSGAASVTLSDGSGVIRVAGEEVFRTAVRDYAAAGIPGPTLGAIRDREQVGLELRRARFSGTAIPASVRVTLNARDPQFVEVEWLPLRMRGRAPIDAWVSSGVVLGRLPRTIRSQLGNGVSLELPSGSLIVFHAEWGFTAHPPRALPVVFGGRPIEAQEVTIRALRHGEESLIEGVSSHTASRISFRIGQFEQLARVDDLLPSEASLSGSLGEGLVTIEVSDATPTSALLAVADEPQGCSFTSSCEVKAADGEPLELEIARARFAAVGRDSEFGESALSVDWAPAHAEIAIGSAQITATAGSSASEGLFVKASAGGATEATCWLDDPVLDIDLGERVIATSRLPRGVRLPIRWRSVGCKGCEGDEVELNATESCIRASCLRTSVLRPTDLLALEFEFHDFELRQRFPWSDARLVPAGPEATMVVRFPPQHVAEPSSFINEECSEETVLRVPIGASYSRPSRLALRPPLRIREDGLELSLDALLGWEDWQLRTVPVALTGFVEPLQGPFGRTGIELSDSARDHLAQHGWDVEPDRSSDLSAADAIPTAAGPMETAIEVPAGLTLSPHKWAVWRHSIRLPETEFERQRVELWHSHMSHPAAAGPQSLATLRAVYSDSFSEQFCPEVSPGLSTCEPVDNCPESVADGDQRVLPSGQDQNQFVHLSSNFSLRASNDLSEVQNETTYPYAPDPIPVEDLMLSALGATLRAHASWDPSLVYGTWACEVPDEISQSCDGDTALARNNRPFTIDEWVQDTVWGRDQFVLVSKKGYVLPFGHQVSLIITAEREFLNADSDAGHGTTAALRRRYFCQVREPTKFFPHPEETGHEYPWVEGRRMPFRSVSLKPNYTPPLLPPCDLVSGTCSDDPESFWMIPDGDDSPFSFGVEAVDLQGVEHSFEMPFLWVRRDRAETGRGFEAIVDRYHSQCESWRTADLHGNKVRYVHIDPNAPPENEKRGSLETGAMVFGVALEGARPPIGGGLEHDCSCENENSGPDDLPSLPFDRENWLGLCFYPAMQTARIREPAIRQFSSDAAETIVRYSEPYHRVGFAVDDVEFVEPDGSQRKFRNPGEVFLDVATSDMNFPGRNSGGLATPSIGVGGLSRLYGPVAGGGFAHSAADDDCEFSCAPSEVREDLAGVNPLVLRTRTTSSISLGGFSPGEFFDAIPSMLMGAIDLRQVLEPIQEVAEELERIPKLLEEEFSDVLAFVREAQQFADEILRIKSDIEQVLERLSELRDLDGLLEAFAAAAIPHIKEELEQQLLEVRGGVIEFAADSQAVHAALDGFARAYEAVSRFCGVEPNDANAPDLTDPNELKRCAKQSLAAYRETVLDELRTQALSDPLLADLEYARSRLFNNARRLLADSPLLEEARRFRGVYNEIRGQFESAPLVKIRAQLEQVQSLVEIFKKPERLAGETARVIESLIKESEAATFIDQQRLELGRVERDAERQLNVLESTTKVAIDANAAAIASQFEVLVDELKQDAPALFNGMSGLVPDAIDFALDAYQNYLNFLAVRAYVDEKLDEKISSLGGKASATKAILDELGAMSAASANQAIRDTVRQAELPELERVLDSHYLAALELTISNVADAHAVFVSLIRVSGSADEAVRRLSKSYLVELRQEAERRLSDLTSCDANPEACKKLNELRITFDEVYGRVRETIAPVKAAYDEIVERVRAEIEKVPKEVKVDYSWNPRVKSGPGGREIFVAERDGKKADLRIDAKIRKSLGITPENFGVDKDKLLSSPTVTIDARLTDFTLKLIPPTEFFIVEFAELGIRSENGSSPDVDVKVAGGALGDQIDYLASLGSFLSPGPGFYIDIEPSAVSAGYQYEFPAITSGAFNLIQLGIHVGIVLPFDGSAVRALLSVSSAPRPFLMSSGVFGGGGFFGIQVSPKGVDRLQGAMEWGAVVSLQIGPASGSARITAGIYFEVSADSAVLEGFFNAVGNFDIAGLISLYISFYLGLRYERVGAQSFAVGRCIVEVEIEIGFFEVSYSLECEKRLKGSETRSDGSEGARLRVAPVLARPGSEPREPSGPSTHRAGRRVYSDAEWQAMRRRSVFAS